MKLWHDDIRRPPTDAWTWARTNQEAIKLLIDYACHECSLDHDLGLHGVDPSEYEKPYELRGTGDETGLDLVKAMCALRLVPPVVRIHSWSPPGAAAMAAHIRDYSTQGCSITISPFVPKL